MKKVDVKKLAKETVSRKVMETLAAAGFDIELGDKYGMSAYTLIVHNKDTDVQIKFITPKAGVQRYEKTDFELESSQK